MSFLKETKAGWWSRMTQSVLRSGESTKTGKGQNYENQNVENQKEH
jgi:hypothetical protein